MHIYTPPPKVVVGRYWWLSDELHDAMQTRMIVRFGYAKSVVEQGEVLHIDRDVFVHPADMVRLQKIT